MKQAEKLTDPQLLTALLGTEKQREEVMYYLYKHSGWREWVINHVCTEGGDRPEGEDVFQEVLILFDRNIREGRFQGSSALQTYFFGIAKQYWFNQKRVKRPISGLSALPETSTIETPETTSIDAEKASIINLILESLGEHCRRVLALYKLSLSNEEIARELNLSSPELAKKYAYRCREKFKAFVMKRKDIMDFLNIHINGQS